MSVDCLCDKALANVDEMTDLIARTDAEDAEFIAALCQIDNEVRLGPPEKGDFLGISKEATCTTGQPVGSYHTHPSTGEKISKRFSEPAPYAFLMTGKGDMYTFLQQLLEPNAPSEMINCLGVRYKGDDYLHCETASLEGLSAEDDKKLKRLANKADRLDDISIAIDKRFNELDDKTAPTKDEIEERDQLEEETFQFEVRALRADATAVNFAKKKGVFSECVPKDSLAPATYIITKAGKVKAHLRLKKRPVKK